jgi:nucleotide-binding universal stress UspA family protein
MHSFRCLTVCLSRTAADAGTIRYAAMVSRIASIGQVRVLHVLPQGQSVDAAQVEADLRAAVDLEFARHAAALQFAVLSGPLIDQILTYVAAEQVDLLMVGHGAGKSGRRALARRLAMKAPCSVWMVPEGAPVSLRHILTPLDFSQHSADTLNVATSLARAGRAACTALHVYFNEAVTTYEEYDQVLRGQEREAYDKFIAGQGTQGVAVRPVFEESSHVAHAIGRVAEREDADLIVMGTRGRSRSAAILLGSVTEETIIESRLPLLAVKHFGARMGVLQALLDKRLLGSGGLHTD